MTGAKVVVADPLGTAGLDLLRGAGARVVDVSAEPDRLAEEIADAQALLVRSRTKVGEDLLAAARKLRVIGRAGVGVDNIDLAAAARHGVLVVNAPTSNLISAVEHTFALLLTLARHLPAAHRSMVGGGWDRKRFSGVELSAKTLGVVGYGKIGRGVAARARAFDMNVVAHDPHLGPAEGERLGVELVSLDDLLARADMVTLHVPLTPETRGLLDASRLAAMKPGALLINCSRGGVVDEAALLDALDSGALAGAGLDVFATEPLADFRLAAHPRVVATPHLGASTREAQERISLEAARMVLAALGGSLAVSAVNLPFAWRPGIRDDLLRLGEQLGRLAAGVLGEPPVRIGVTPGTPGTVPPEVVRPLTLAVAVGALGAGRPGGAPVEGSSGRVSYVNVEQVAAAAGVALETAERAGGPETPEAVGVTVTGVSGETVELGGALLDGSRPRVVRFGSIPLEFRPVGRLLVLRSRDVPGVVGQVGGLLGEAGVNIADVHLARRDGEPEAWTVLRLDQTPEPSVLAALAALPPMTAVRPVEL